MASVVLIPFAAFIGLFLLYPTIVVLYKAVTPGGTLGFDALARALSGTKASPRAERATSRRRRLKNSWR